MSGLPTLHALSVQMPEGETMPYLGSCGIPSPTNILEGQGAAQCPRRPTLLTHLEGLGEHFGGQLLTTSHLEMPSPDAPSPAGGPHPTSPTWRALGNILEEAKLERTALRPPCSQWMRCGRVPAVAAAARMHAWEGGLRFMQAGPNCLWMSLPRCVLYAANSVSGCSSLLLCCIPVQYIHAVS